MRQLPIGFIDSGVGGLTVVKQSLKQLPNESIIYLGDNARCPYGERSTEEVREYIWELTQFLLKKQIKMLVIACNTGTAAALDDVRKQLNIPVVGVIHPGSRAAIKVTNSQRIGIIGTRKTIESKMYERTLLEKVAELQLTSVACPQFVDIVERQTQLQDESKQYIQEVLVPINEANVDTLILGCTHYPLLKKEIQDVVGSQVTLVDSGVETINEVSTLLDYFGLSRTAQDQVLSPATQQYYTTGDVMAFRNVATTWLNNDTLQVTQCKINGGEIIEINNSKS